MGQRKRLWVPETNRKTHRKKYTKRETVTPGTKVADSQHIPIYQQNAHPRGTGDWRRKKNNLKKKIHDKSKDMST